MFEVRRDCASPVAQLSLRCSGTAFTHHIVLGRAIDVGHHLRSTARMPMRPNVLRTEPLDEKGGFSPPLRSTMLLRDDLNSLALYADRAIHDSDDLLRAVPARRAADHHRDILHLRARIDGIASQIKDALSTLERLEERDPVATSARTSDRAAFHRSEGEMSANALDAAPGLAFRP